MTLSNLIPWTWGKKNLPIRKETSSNEFSPIFSLQQDMNSMFDDFFRTFETGMLSPFSQTQVGLFQPQVEVKETSKDVQVSVELPGLEDKDIDLSISDDYLTIKGEKREEKEENNSSYYRMERMYGSFQRRVPFPCAVDRDKAEATFKRGVLTVVLPKTADSHQHIKKIPIRKG
jgi:HSP20 family protein